MDITVYERESLRELAEEFLSDGLFGPAPETLAPYIDLDAIARDLSFDYQEREIAGRRFFYQAL